MLQYLPVGNRNSVKPIWETYAINENELVPTQTGIENP